MSVPILNHWRAQYGLLNAGLTTLSPIIGSVNLTSLGNMAGTPIADKLDVTSTPVTLASQPAPTAGRVYTMFFQFVDGGQSSFYLRYSSGTVYVRLRVRWDTGVWLLETRDGGAIVAIDEGPLPTGWESGLTISTRDNGTSIVVHTGTQAGEASTTIANGATSVAWLVSGGTGDFTRIYRTVLASVGGLNSCVDFEFGNGSIVGGSEIDLSVPHSWVIRRRKSGLTGNANNTSLITAGATYAAKANDYYGEISPRYLTASGQEFTSDAYLVAAGTTQFLTYYGTTGTQSQLAAMNASVTPTVYTSAKTLGTPSTTLTLPFNASHLWHEIALVDGVLTAAQIKEMYDTADWSTLVAIGNSGIGKKRFLLMGVG